MAFWTPAYNTNGFAHHRLHDAVTILAAQGYRGLALTLDVHHLDPFDQNHEKDCVALRSLLAECGFRVGIESGARFNLNAARKHYPSLLCRKDGVDRLDFLRRCHDTALAIGAEYVSLWSGHNFEDLETPEAWDLLATRIDSLTRETKGSGVAWAIEPEPGMFLETLDQYLALSDLVTTKNFGLALDLGHLLVTQERSCPGAIREFRDDIVTVAIEDMRVGLHDHLPFGEGDMDFPPIFEALREISFSGILSVELSRSSSRAPQEALASIQFLRDLGAA